MQNMQNDMCKIFNEDANKYVEYVNKYKNMKNVQNMRNHFPTCIICVSTEYAKNVEYAKYAK